MKTYAIDKAVDGTRNFISTGTTLKASRQSAAINQAGKLYPNKVLRVRLISTPLEVAQTKTEAASGFFMRPTAPLQTASAVQAGK